MTLPQTGFEQRGHTAPWTTFPEEHAYTTALLNQLPTISVEQAGVGASNLPILAYHLGTGPRTVLIVAQVHAPELSGRDALLTQMREWATNPAWAAYFTQARVIMVPTIRPDSQTERNNPNGVNVNRDHIAITQPETMALHSLIRDYQPEVIVDLHEGANITAETATSKVLNPNIYAPLQNLSHDLEQAVKTGVEAEGITWEPYQNHNIRGPEYFSNIAGVRHAVGLLIETRRKVGRETDAGDRWWWHCVTTDAVLAWHATHLEETEIACALSRTEAPHRHEIQLLSGTSTQGPKIIPPTAYLVDDLAPLAGPITAFNLDVVGNVVSAEDENAVLIHYLLHPASPLAVTVGTPLGVTADEVAGHPWWRTVQGDVQAARLGTPTGTITLWPKRPATL